MNTFMNLPDSLIEQLEVEELVLVKGGSIDPPGSPNNADGRCSGSNNAGGRCSGPNNDSGYCGS